MHHLCETRSLAAPHGSQMVASILFCCIILQQTKGGVNILWLPATAQSWPVWWFPGGYSLLLRANAVIVKRHCVGYAPSCRLIQHMVPSVHAALAPGFCKGSITSAFCTFYSRLNLPWVNNFLLDQMTSFTFGILLLVRVFCVVPG